MAVWEAEGQTLFAGPIKMLRGTERGLEFLACRPGLEKVQMTSVQRLWQGGRLPLFVDVHFIDQPVPIVLGTKLHVKSEKHLLRKYDSPQQKGILV